MLDADIEPAPANPFSKTWQLREEAEKGVLRELGTAEQVRAALETNPNRTQEPLQRTFETYITDSAPPLDQQTATELRQSLTVVRWLADIIPGLPSSDEIEARLRLREVVDLFESMAAIRFYGRQQELEMLRDFVETQQEAGTPMIISAPGGFGKTTLLGRYLLDQISNRLKPQFPFAYLDFDRPALAFDEPATLFEEAARQLQVFYPDHSAAFADFRAQLNEYLESRSDQGNREVVAETELERYDLAERQPLDREDNRMRLMFSFRTAIQRLTNATSPFLLVFDTMEEAQYRSGNDIARFRLILEASAANLPHMRAVFAGRTELPGLTAAEPAKIDLFRLDPEAARQFVISEGVTDAGVAAQIAALGGGIPLSLKLAVEAVKREGGGSEAIAKLDGAGVFDALTDTVLQGQLYDRILNRIHNPKVKPLAHPGLVLRRITPEIIFSFLALKCGVELSTKDEAEELFKEFAKEVSLVKIERDGSLRHRPDLRAVMLDLLKQDRSPQVEQIDRAAVDFYSRSQNTADRAEEIYHRLRLGQSSAILDQRWIEGVGEYLRTSADEFDASGRAYLASQTSDCHRRVGISRRRSRSVGTCHSRTSGRTALEGQCTSRAATHGSATGSVRTRVCSIRSRRERGRSRTRFHWRRKSFIAVCSPHAATGG